MQIFRMPPNIPVMVIDDFYTPTELSLLWKEIDFLTAPEKFKPPQETGAAQDGEKYLKFANGIWVDNVYADRNMSNILTCNRKVFCNSFISEAKAINPLYCVLESVNSDSTLLNYYEDGEEYKKHKDDSVFTAVTMLMKDANSFSGGDFVLHDFDLLVEKKDNRLILFPGILNHSVTPVKMQQPYAPFAGYGRYTISQFMCVK